MGSSHPLKPDPRPRPPAEDDPVPSPFLSEWLEDLAAEPAFDAAPTFDPATLPLPGEPARNPSFGNHDHLPTLGQLQSLFDEVPVPTWDDESRLTTVRPMPEPSDPLELPPGLIDASETNEILQSLSELRWSDPIPGDPPALQTERGLPEEVDPPQFLDLVPEVPPAPVFEDQSARPPTVSDRPERSETVERWRREVAARARFAMAQPAVAEPEAPTKPYVVFEIAGCDYALPLDHLREIGHPPPVTPLPNVPEWVVGVTNLRGEIVSVVDFRAFGGNGFVPASKRVRFLVARASDGDVTVGLIVEALRGMRRLPIDWPREAAGGWADPFGSAAGQHEGRRVVVLDPDRLLLSEQMRSLAG